MLSVASKGQIPDLEQCRTQLFGPNFAICEDICLRLMPFFRGSHSPLNGLQPFFFISYTYGAIAKVNIRKTFNLVSSKDKCQSP